VQNKLYFAEIMAKNSNSRAYAYLDPITAIAFRAKSWFVICVRFGDGVWGMGAFGLEKMELG
jgi:hypothetical protein